MAKKSSLMFWISTPSGTSRYMSLTLVSIPTEIGNEKERKRNRERKETAEKKTGIVSGKENAKETERGSEIARIERRAEAEAGVKGRAIINVRGHPLHQAMKGVIMERAHTIKRRTILNYKKHIHLVNNGQKMAPKIKILPKKISQHQ